VNDPGLYREGVEPSGPLRKVSDHMIVLVSCPLKTAITYRAVVGRWLV
jgi:hypothetical protein